jgi:hypothetical protein
MTLTSKLEAINSMLACIGESPINSLDEGTVDSVIAQSTLDEVSRNVQATGWHCNTDSDFPLVRDTNNEIPLTQDIVRVDVDSIRYPNVNVVQRSGKLYDRKNHTFTFNDDLKAEVIRILEWDDLPQPFRTFITAKAARMFQQRVVGSNELSQQLAQDEMTALVALREFEADTGDFNVFDHYDVARVLERY